MQETRHERETRKGRKKLDCWIERPLFRELQRYAKRHSNGCVTSALHRILSYVAEVNGSSRKG